jgi:hypothetical protein
MALNSVYRLRTQGSTFAQSVEFGVHIQQVTPTGGAADLAGLWRTQIIPSLAAASSEHVFWDQITVNDTSVTGESSFVLPIFPAVPGTVLGESLPPFNAMVVTWQTGLKGKRRAGRIYLPGVGEANQQNGQLLAAQMTLNDALAQDILDGFGPTGINSNYRLVVYSPPTAPFKAPTPPPVHTDTLITPITSHVSRQQVHVQRRRALGVGR